MSSVDEEGRIVVYESDGMLEADHSDEEEELSDSDSGDHEDIHVPDSDDDEDFDVENFAVSSAYCRVVNVLFSR